MAGLRRVALGLLALLLLLSISALAAIWWFGAWRILFPSSGYETTPPALPADLHSPSLLLFTKTNRFRHEEGIAAGIALFEEMGRDNGWSVWQTENSAVFNESDLQRFDLVVYLNSTGASLGPLQRQSLRNWVEAGGSWLGIHAAADDSHAYWPWYVETLIGVEFTAHILGPQLQLASVVNEAPAHPVMQGLAGSWTHTEEWYSWRKAPDDELFVILASVDEDSYNPRQKILNRDMDLRMGHHPIAWTRCVDRGRSLYSALGHAADAYAADEHRQLLKNATTWLLDDRQSPCK